ncbi:hypothetical protein G9A89_009811 [Geosiphon pyriformis]|nr:hypothetical protein G9A89_009811 [Geosiphon pyriformis]
MHSDSSSAHFGKDSTIQRTLEYYFWPQMKKDIHKYVESCDSCQKRRGTRLTEPLNPIKVGQPFDQVAKVSTNFEQEWNIFIPSVLLAYRTLKQDTTKHTPFDLTYGRTAILPISFTVETYPAQPIDKNNFQETLQRRAYTLLSTLERKQRIAATHIEHSQAQQKERHNNKLPPITNKFKVGNKVLLHRTKAEKQWSGKFENK